MVKFNKVTVHCSDLEFILKYLFVLQEAIKSKDHKLPIID